MNAIDPSNNFGGGKVKFFSPSGGIPTPPTYLNYIGMVAGSFANQQGLNGTDGEIIIPLNNVSLVTSPTNPKNITSVDFANSGQNIEFYIVGANIVISNADSGIIEFTGRIFVDGEEIYRRLFEIDEFGVMYMVLDNAVSVSSEIYVSLTTDNISFDIISSNWLFYSTGNIIPPPACQYADVLSSNTGYNAIRLNPNPQFLVNNSDPIIVTTTNLRSAVNYVRINIGSPFEFVVGETYYIEVKLPMTVPTNIKVCLGTIWTWTDPNRYDALLLGNTTSVQSALITCGSNTAYALEIGLQTTIPLASAMNGTIEVRIGNSYCP